MPVHCIEYRHAGLSEHRGCAAVSRKTKHYTIRAFLCCIFCIIAIPEVLTGGDTAFHDYFMSVPSNVTTASNGNVYYVYVAYILMLLNEALLVTYCLYNLTDGIFREMEEPIRQYLVCRFVTWLMELSILFVLTLIHGVLIGWYLIMLMIVILEFYGIIVVYSYYKKLIKIMSPKLYKSWNEWDNRKEKKCCFRHSLQR